MKKTFLFLCILGVSVNAVADYNRIEATVKNISSVPIRIGVTLGVDVLEGSGQANSAYYTLAAGGSQLFIIGGVIHTVSLEFSCKARLESGGSYSGITRIFVDRIPTGGSGQTKTSTISYMIASNGVPVVYSPPVVPPVPPMPTNTPCIYIPWGWPLFPLTEKIWADVSPAAGEWILQNNEWVWHNYLTDPSFNPGAVFSSGNGAWSFGYPPTGAVWGSSDSSDLIPEWFVAPVVNTSFTDGIGTVGGTSIGDAGSGGTQPVGSPFVFLPVVPEPVDYSNDGLDSGDFTASVVDYWGGLIYQSVYSAQTSLATIAGREMSTDVDISGLTDLASSMLMQLEGIKDNSVDIGQILENSESEVSQAVEYLNLMEGLLADGFEVGVTVTNNNVIGITLTNIWNSGYSNSPVVVAFTNQFSIDLTNLWQDAEDALPLTLMEQLENYWNTMLEFKDRLVTAFRISAWAYGLADKLIGNWQTLGRVKPHWSMNFNTPVLQYTWNSDSLNDGVWDIISFLRDCEVIGLGVWAFFHFGKMLSGAMTKG